MTNNYAIIKDIDELKAILERIDQSPDKTVGFDIETGYYGPDRKKGSLDPDHGVIAGFSFGQSEWARYVPLEHDMYEANLDSTEVWDLMAPYIGIWEDRAPDDFEDDMEADERFGRLLSVHRRLWNNPTTDTTLSAKGWKIIIHNVKFERRWLRRVGIEVACFSDSMIEAFALGSFESISLKKLTKDVFGHEQQEITTLFPQLTKSKLDCMRFTTLEITGAVVDYACEDALWAVRLHKKHYEQVKDKTIFKVEFALTSIVADMEDEGAEMTWNLMRKDAKQAEQIEARLLKEILADLEALIGEKLPPKFNLNSPPQLQAILYDRLGMAVTRRTPTGNPSTDAVALEALSKKHDVVKKLLEFREIQALRKRFLEKWPNEFSDNRRDGRAHASFNQTAVGTGRFAVNDPPLQQCPKPPKYAVGLDTEQRDLFLNSDPRDPKWRELWESIDDHDKLSVNFRNHIVAPEGYYILDFDYSQVELRVMAGLSQEQTLLDAFNNDIDVHRVTAATMLGVPIDQLTKEQRAVGKTMNFALLYGMGVNSLADRLALTRERARELYDAYFAGFASITEWMERTKREGKQNRYTISWAGRKYTIWELYSSNPKIYSKGERVCVNAPVQGGAADYMKIAMVRVRAVINQHGWRDKVRLIMNNHDALTFYVHHSLNPLEVRRALLPAVEYAVPNFPKIVSEWEMGYAWGSMKPIHHEDGRTEYGLTQDADGKWHITVPDEADLEDDDDEEPPAAFTEGPEHGFSTAGPAGDDDFPEPTKGGAGPTSVDAGTPPEERPATSQSRASLHEARSADTAAIPTGTVNRLIVQLREMPTIEQYTGFQRLIATRPGHDIVTISTPEGDVDMDSKTDLSPKDAAIISMTLGGASVHYASDGISSEALADIEL